MLSLYKNMRFMACAALAVMALAGCSTMIDQDTKLSLKGPKAELARKF